MLTVLAVLLAIWKVCAALCVPIVPEVKLRLVGAVVTGAPPLPLRPANANKLLLLSYRLTAPVMDPTSVGVKESFAVQEWPPATLPPQLSVSEKSPLVTKLTA